MNATTITGAVTTALWILIELIQFAYMAYMTWRHRNDTGRNIFRTRPVDSCA